VPRATEGLMGKFNAVGFCADCVGKGCDGDGGWGCGTCVGVGHLGTGQHRHDWVMLGGRTCMASDWESPQIRHRVFVAA
jgi:hypothetical protein